MEQIYEIREGIHVDLEKVALIKQQVSMKTCCDEKILECWIEIVTDNGGVAKIYCDAMDSKQDPLVIMQNTYNVLLLAWRQYYREKDAIKQPANFYDISKESPGEYDI